MEAVDLILFALVTIITIVVIIIFLQRFFPQRPSITKIFQNQSEKTIEINIEELAKNNTPEALWRALNAQIVMLHDIGRYAEASQIAEEALEVIKNMYGPEHVHVATALNNLGALYKGQGRFNDAESLLKEAIKIWEKSLGNESYENASGLNNLADLYTSQEKYDDAEGLYKKSLEIFETILGKSHPNVATLMENLANLYNKTGNITKATILTEQARLIRAKGTENPKQ